METGTNLQIRRNSTYDYMLKYTTNTHQGEKIKKNCN